MAELLYTAGRYRYRAKCGYTTGSHKSTWTAWGVLKLHVNGCSRCKGGN